MAEDDENITKKEDIGTTDEEPGSETKIDSDNPEEPKTEEECDPLTEACNKLRDGILDLAERKQKLKSSEEALKKLKETYPEDKSIDDLQEKTEKEMEEVDEDVNDAISGFAMCTRDLETKEKGEGDEEKEPPKE